MRDAASDVIAEWCSQDWARDPALSRLVPELGEIEKEVKDLSPSKLRERLDSLVTDWMELGLYEGRERSNTGILSQCKTMASTFLLVVRYIFKNIEHVGDENLVTWYTISMAIDRLVIESRCPDYAGKRDTPWNWLQRQREWAERQPEASRFQRYYDAIMHNRFIEVESDFEEELERIENQQQKYRDAGIQILTTEVTTLENPETTKDSQRTSQVDSEWFWEPGWSLAKATESWKAKGLQDELINDFKRDGWIYQQFLVCLIAYISQQDFKSSRSPLLFARCQMWKKPIDQLVPIENLGYDYVYSFFNNIDTRVTYKPSKLRSMEWTWSNGNWAWNAYIDSNGRNSLVNPNAVLFENGAKLHVDNLDDGGKAVIELPPNATVYEVICQINSFYTMEIEAPKGLDEAGRYYSHRWERHPIEVGGFKKYRSRLDGGEYWKLEDA
ncbi:uncharacterized protein B0I36DRAFT_356480 [Microdochium trichocladiopsis]|uniref:Uncharacterized protein n=1 Tax=Microdochium trichocladiopsis TaxID=1682393 RepID=A0A9P8XQ92_9PEZI|nr:uncharacterized protein B0I36DRAFT_356480 [Microdochium trichocladiopsis]KAH7010886.1 hypothetical protein B0I36DRAFT_356480 [Microdochium trichocladiopsis]